MERVVRGGPSDEMGRVLGIVEGEKKSKSKEKAKQSRAKQGESC